MLPAFLTDVAYRVRRIFGRDTAERDMAGEMELHIDLETERLMREGLSPDQARRQARLEFGGVEQIKESARDAWGTRTIDILRRDLKHALRLATRQPVFSTVVTLSLALGLAATITVVNVAWNILFAPLDLPRPNELITLMRWTEDGRDVMFRWREVEALRSAPGTTLAAMRGASAVAVRAGEQRHFTNIDFVDGNYFALLRARAQHGRLISPTDDSTSAPVIVVSRQFAEQLFPGDSNVVGHVVDVRGAAFTIIGVAHDSYRGVRYPAWFTAAIPLGSVPLLHGTGAGSDSRGIPYGRGDDRLTDRVAFQVVGRVTTGGESSKASLLTAFQRCCGTARDGRREWIEVVDMSRGIPGGKGDIRRDVRGTLGMVVAGMGLLLVVVCCNVASLLLVRATARQREMAVRLSLGASRRRLVWQLVAETVPLAVAGGAGGLLLAAWFTSFFATTLPSDWVDIAAMFQFRASPLILGFAAALTAACTIAFAVQPALRATRLTPAPMLRVNTRSTRTRSQRSVAHGVIIAQVALAVVLVSSAALLASTLVNMSRADVGLPSGQALLVGLGTRSTEYEARGAIPVAEDIARAVETVPGVRDVTMATLIPLYGGANYQMPVVIPGLAVEPGREPTARLVVARAGYFATSGLRLIEGREFAAGEGSRGENVAIVNQSFVKRYLSGRVALGQSIGIEAQNDINASVPAVIVGVCADASYNSVKDDPQPYVYIPLAGITAKWNGMQLLVRTSETPATVSPQLLKAIQSAAPGIEMRRVRDVATQRAYSTATERITANLAVFVSVLTLVLATIGLYAVVAYGVSRRVSEIGVRLALGARAGSILWLVTRDTVWMVGSGIALGVALSFGATGAMRSQFYGVDAHDPLSWLGAALMLVITGSAASVIPARRATRVDPRIAMQAD